VATCFGELDTFEPVSRAELKRCLRNDSVLVLDVRPRDEFEAGHMPGAVNVPPSELDARLSSLPVDREILVYCRGPYCVLAFEAVALLRAGGFHVRRLEDRFPEWKAVGLKVEAA
jgi:ArsR family transcriptional regulator